MPPKLGIIAGGGDLPLRLVEACRSAGREVFVLGLEGHADPEGGKLPVDRWSRLGAAGAMLDALREAGVRDIVLAGRVRRPSLAELKPDWRAARLFARIGARALGDDGLLRAVTSELEGEGFRVVATQDVFRDLLTPAGNLGAFAPDAQAEVDIARGVEVIRALGHLDVGQAVIVQQGIVLGVEAIEGTDALIDRCGSLRREGPGGVLVKMSKPGQDTRFDLPTVGAVTVERCAAAGLRGIAVEAGKSIMLDRETMAGAADARGLFIVGLEVPQ
ncbi:UDP-2,3-diacylglucosamine diphosphatase LpxI [Skermanella sp. TT6]|uniref:UDP-2,3-diacylglucosamine diphosphatase LpxI n=1 Tax=Skermanella cutis TaxID=2775420 RepID=A0ABX7BCG9_9PROT|nr:UDP-2,3-diacylglucosamine diphosphatase LpxI [Skermanella sp. TT6]QQP92098.1 UDP-2,3-diacylglucosamine diphosphatase LpxI [Skermanella sp. TT6]